MSTATITQPTTVADVEAAYSTALAEARAFSAAHHVAVGTPFGLTPAEAVEHHERVVGIEKTYRRTHRDMLRTAERNRRDDLRRIKAADRAARKAAKRG